MVLLSAKYEARIFEVRAKLLGLPRISVLRNVNCLPVLQYLAQLFEPLRGVVKTHKACLQKLACGPRHALSHGMLSHL